MPELADLLKRIEELRKILRGSFLMYEYGKWYLNSNK
ncbi:hypothetical protein Ga0466249_003364 [Sporomusaceae bacterium BoRhaA]|nr:hypothetical protein [Pelorhabdus rhamnosifermentans]